MPTPPLRTLVVEPSRLAARHLLGILQGARHEAFEVADLRLAKGLLDGKPIQLVVLGSELPSDGAVRLLGALRRSPRYFEVPAVVVAALGTERAWQAFAEGGVRLVRRPVEPHVLLEQIEGAVAWQAGEGALERRLHFRRALNTAMRFRVTDGYYRLGQCLDLSLGGLKLLTPSLLDLTEGTGIHLDLLAAPPIRGLVGTVRRCTWLDTGTELGVAFDRPSWEQLQALEALVFAPDRGLDLRA